MKIKRGIVVQKLGDLFVAYDNRAGVLFEFNEVGFFIFNQIKKGKTREEILKKIIAQFDVLPTRATKDVNSFLAILKKKDLIETP